VDLSADVEAALAEGERPLDVADRQIDVMNRSEGALAHHRG
jgi:hypothetical protein